MLSLLKKVLRFRRARGCWPGWENFRLRRRPEMPLPGHLQIEPTTRCNLCCVACPHENLPAGRKNANLSFEFFERIVTQVPGLREIKLQGLGEPFLAPDLIRMLEWGTGRGIQYDVITNGNLPKETLLAGMPHLARLGISLDAVTPATAARLRSNTNLELVKKNVQAIVEEKRWKGLKCQTRINCVVSHANMQEVRDVMRFGMQAGVDIVNFMVVENWKLPGEPGYEDSRQFAREGQRRVGLGAIRRTYEEGGFKFGLGLQDAAPRKGNCYWCFSSVFVTCDGFVTPCCVRPNPDRVNFGNLNGQSFESIWNGEKLREFRRTHLEGRPNPVCDSCPA